MSEKNVLHGKTLELPVYRENAGKFLLEALSRRNGDELAFINDASGETLTCAKLLENSIGLSRTLSSCDFIQNGVIALCSENHVNYMTVVYGALFAGVPIAFINPNYTEYELQNALNVTKPAIVFCSSPHLGKFHKLQARNDFIKDIIVIDRSKNPKSLLNFTRRFANDPLTHFEPKEVDVAENVAFILFSSGTTGLPKGVMLSHLGVNATLAALLAPDGENQYESDAAVQILPQFHVYGLFMTIVSIYRGRKMVLIEKFDPETYLKYIEKYKIALLVTVPPLVQFFLKSKTVDKYDLSSVKEIICGAAPLSKDLAEAIKKKFKLRILRNGYGMTEAGLSISFPPLDVEVPGSVGYVFPGMSLVIKDPDTGENLGPNRRGEICIRGLMVMKGYYGDPEATRQAFTGDGWLRTGDIGYYDEEELLYVVDRLKELIKYKGFQVAPAELEHLLVNHPKIQDAGVVGIPDERAGELPAAFVVKQPNVDLTEEEIHRYVNQFVSQNKRLYGGVRFVDEIPRNPSGKIIRRKLRELLKNLKSKL